MWPNDVTLQHDFSLDGKVDRVDPRAPLTLTRFCARLSRVIRWVVLRLKTVEPWQNISSSISSATR